MKEAQGPFLLMSDGLGVEGGGTSGLFLLVPSWGLENNFHLADLTSTQQAQGYGSCPQGAEFLAQSDCQELGQ